MNLKLPTASLSRFSYGKRIHPTRDWFAVLMVALVLVAGSALWNAWFFYSGLKEGATEASADRAPALSPALLTETNTLLDAREAEGERFRSEYRFVDPSSPGS